MNPAHERNWAMLTHVVPAAAMVLSAGTMGFLGSLIIYLMYKDRGPFVRAHAANSLNVQLSALIGLLISGVLMLVAIGFITYPLVVVWAVVLHILGAVRAGRGEWFEPPLTFRFFR